MPETDPRTGGPDPLRLTPPEPVPHIDPGQAAGLVPLDAALREELQQRAAHAVASLTELDARSPEFAARIDDVTSVGAHEMRAAAVLSGRMLDRSIRSLSQGASGGGSGAQTRVMDSLLELRRTVRDLSPGEAEAGAFHRFVTRLPFVGRVRDHLARYDSAQVTLHRIVSDLQAGRAELARDSATLQAERDRLWETMRGLQEYVILVAALEAQLQTRIDELGPIERVQADTLRADVLFPVQQKHQDLLTQLAVCGQGYLAMHVVRRNTDELVKGVDRAMTTTLTALRVGLMLSAAMDNQRRVAGQVRVLRDTTEELVAANATLIGETTEATQRIAADPAVGVDVLRDAFDQIHRTLDAIDTYRAQATASMAASVRSLATVLEGASGRLERTRGTPTTTGTGEDG